MNEPRKKNDPNSRWGLLLRTGTPWLVALLGSVGVGALLMLLAGVFSPKVPEADAPAPRLVPAGARIVDAIMIRQPRYETAVGTIEPIHQSSVAAKILAKVDEVNVSAGQLVEAGEVLVVLNDDDLQSRLKQAEAQRDSAVARAQQAKSDFDRAQRLIANNAISRAEYDGLATTVRTSEAELQRSERAIEEARVFIDYAVIRAPYAGMVVEKQVQAGDTVSPGQTLLTLYDPNQMQLVADVRESLAMKLKIGQELPAKLETLDHACMATVREVVPQADAGSRSFQVKVSGPCPPGIYSGMFGRLMLPLGDEEILIIPKEAVRRVGQLTLVNVVEEDALVRRHIQVGRTLEDNVEVLSGLVAGEQVAILASHEGAH